MEPLTIDRTHILVLNYNGRDLLAECLPSVVEAAGRSPVPCRVTVVDNGSTDGSRELVAPTGPRRGFVREPNRGLASFNRVLARLRRAGRPAAEQRRQARPGRGRPRCSRSSRPTTTPSFSAPLCWTFDGRTYEGMRTRVRTRFGLVQGMCRVPGFETVVDTADLTAAAGPVLAVDRRQVPGARRLRPDLLPRPDRGPRPGLPRLDGRLAGLLRAGVGRLPPRLRHVRPQLGRARCDRLAIRNSLIFAWKNRAGPAADPPALAPDPAWLTAAGGRPVAFGLLRPCVEAVHRAARRVLAVGRALAVGQGGGSSGRRRSFERFQW